MARAKQFCGSVCKHRMFYVGKHVFQGILHAVGSISVYVLVILYIVRRVARNKESKQDQSVQPSEGGGGYSMMMNAIQWRAPTMVSALESGKTVPVAP